MQLFDVALNIVLVSLTVAGAWAGTSRVLKKATTEGVSLISTSMVLLSVSTWLGYGLVMGNIAQVFTSAVAATGAIVTLVVGYRTGTLRTGVTVGSAGGYAVTVLALGTLLGIAVVGSLATVLSTLNKVPQVLESWKNPGGMGVSISSNAMAAACSAGWVLYGAMRVDLFVIGSSSIGIAHGIYMVVRTVQGRRSANLVAGEAAVPASAPQSALALAAA